MFIISMNRFEFKPMGMPIVVQYPAPTMLKRDDSGEHALAVG